MYNNYFKGWYFKHQLDENTVAFIPGTSEDGAFIQVIYNDGTMQFDINNFVVKNDIIYADSCEFSKNGCIIKLPDITAKLIYTDLRCLKSDIMGPFKYLPLQCKHGVISMEHRVKGYVKIKDKTYNFDNGNGYIEMDSGVSFPKKYLWVQCNDFNLDCSFMLAIAHIPFGVFTFTGCICVVIYNDKEYRFATYNGVKIIDFSQNHIILKQGKFTLEVFVNPSNDGYTLNSPVNGKMNGRIKESCNAHLKLKLSCDNKTIVETQSNYSMYEFFE